MEIFQYIFNVYLIAYVNIYYLYHPHGPALINVLIVMIDSI